MSTLISFSETVCFEFSDCITAFGPAICHFLTYSSVEVIIKAQDISVGGDLKGHLIRSSYLGKNPLSVIRNHSIIHSFSD